MTTAYCDFINSKRQKTEMSGFDPIWMPDFLKDFQVYLTDWAIRIGRGEIMADCGMGKTPMQLTWAQNVLMKTNKPVLILAPLAVSHQTAREGEKFGVECCVSHDGSYKKGVVVITNYERLHYFDPHDFSGVVCDESSCLKNADAKRRLAITEFMREKDYRLLCTATAAPNDYYELGTSSEALGYLGYQDMLTKFFKQEVKQDYLGWGRTKYRFRGHAELHFWRWVCSWARVCRKPSDLGYDDGDFILPELREHKHLIEMSKPRDGFLFPMPAGDLREEREEQRYTIKERCELVADIVAKHKGASVCWCHLNEEGDMLQKIIPNAEQISGNMSDDKKEERLIAFQSGQIPVLITKPKIGCYGLNWQHCCNVATFASHSWEQYYQLVRRCWRFGQQNQVDVHVIATSGQDRVLRSMERKAMQADRMFSEINKHVNEALHIDASCDYQDEEVIPAWL